MVIIEDTRQKIAKNADIRAQLKELGHDVKRFSLPCGDYQIMGRGSVTVDTKQDMHEVYSNIIHDNARFKRECELAKSGGVQLVVLVTDSAVSCLDDVAKWKNPRREKWFYINAAHQKGKMQYVKIPKIPPASPEQLKKAMQTMSERYGVKWQFCSRADAAQKILAILQND